MHASVPLAAILVGTLGFGTVPAVISEPSTIYRTDAYSVDARWFTGAAPNRIYFDVIAWTGTEKIGPGAPIPVAGANAGWSIEQPDGTFLPKQGCSPSGTNGATAAFTFPDGALFVDPNLQSSRLSLTFDCFSAGYPYNPTGPSLKIVMNWISVSPTRIQAVGRPGNSTFEESSETIASGSATDGVHEYAAGPASFAVVRHQMSDVVIR